VKGSFAKKRRKKPVSYWGPTRGKILKKNQSIRANRAARKKRQTTETIKLGRGDQKGEGLTQDALNKLTARKKKALETRKTMRPVKGGGPFNKQRKGKEWEKRKKEQKPGSTYPLCDHKEKEHLNLHFRETGKKGEKKNRSKEKRTLGGGGGGGTFKKKKEGRCTAVDASTERLWKNTVKKGKET